MVPIKTNSIKLLMNECNEFMKTLTGHVLERKDVLHWFEVSIYKIFKKMFQCVYKF